MGMVFATKLPFSAPVIVVYCDTLDLVQFLVWSLLYVASST
jgi:hypothetical protein